MSIKIKLAAIAKDEGAYIPQWIHHHLFFGFDEFEIWINGTTDNSIEILETIKRNHPPGTISYINADKFLAECKAKNEHFQMEAYSEIYRQALNSSDCTHIMFLDLDEFWTPKDFQTSIKEAISINQEADAVSFQWFLDTPDIERQLFQLPFERVNTLQKNRHVKTAIKITPRIKKIEIHNHIIDNGNYKLCNGDDFLETDRSQHNRAAVSPTHFNETRNIVDDFFIFHQINRSRVEYLSSLLRGRNHANDSKLFKVNREGYINERFSHQGLIHSISDEKLNKYKSSHQHFITTYSTSNLIKEAQEFIHNRFLQAIQHLRANPTLINEYKKQLRGVKINDLIDRPINVNSITYIVDKIEPTQDNSSIKIFGWAFDSLSSSQIKAAVLLPSGGEVFFSFNKTKRPDVIKVHPDAHLECGFQIEIKNTHLQTKEDTPLTSFKLYLKSNSYFEELILSPQNKQ